MKKLLTCLIAIISSFIVIENVNAETINSINMDIYVDNEGTAHVTEEWNATPSEKTEYYHAYYNIGNSKISDLKVKDESTDYTEKSWNINGSLSDKAYKYGYNYTNNGVELCFGKSSYGYHTYTLTYTISNFVSNTSDYQMIYWNLLDSITPAPDNVEIVIHADEAFSDDLDVWGYGNYGGLAYVYDGKIYLSNDHLSTSDYMVILAKFPLNTFNTTNNLDNNFDYYYNMAEDGSTHYKDNSSSFSIGSLFVVLFQIFFWFLFILGIVKASSTSGLKSGSYNMDFGEAGKKLPKDINMFRDLPCNKDIFRAYWVASNYNLMKKQTDFLGTILLKWLKQGHIKIENKTVGAIFKKEDTTIVFENKDIILDNNLETKLYKYMYEASKDGILESKEFEKWCSNHYSTILKWFDDVLDYETDKLVLEGKVMPTEKVTLKIFKNTVYQIDASMKEEAIQMKGLKMFFDEFDNMSDKEAIEVMLWEEYLMYAQIFGLANKVAKQFKKLYPDVITDYNYDSIVFIDMISYHGMTSASTARSRAESYSSGGGGFSSGGGGGGSFGGGGGGSR